MKKLFSCFLLLGVGLLPFFGTITEASNLTVQIPTDLWEKNDDIYIKAKGSSANAVVGNEKTLYSTLNLINDYLWWSFWAIAMGLTIYAGYEVITWDGDKKCNHQDCCQYYITFSFIIFWSKKLILKILN